MYRPSNNKSILVLVNNHIEARFDSICQDFGEQLEKDIAKGDWSVISDLGRVGYLRDKHEVGLGLGSRQGAVGMEIIEGFKNGRPQNIPVVLIEFGHVVIRFWALSLPHYHKGFVDSSREKLSVRGERALGGGRGGKASL